jgi:hypothetical protein
VLYLFLRSFQTLLSVAFSQHKEQIIRDFAVKDGFSRRACAVYP